MTTEAPDAAETAKQEMTPEQGARYWQVQLHLAEREHKDWWLEADEIQARYKRDKLAIKNKAARRYNILYSNTETLRGVVYARTAKPDVRRRYTMQDEVGKTIAEVIERALSFFADDHRHETAMSNCVKDMLIAGRGTVRVQYEPQIGQAPVIDPMTGMPAMGPDGQPMMQQVVIDQKLTDKHVYWRDFMHNPARDWNDVWWVAFRHRMSRDDLKDNGFEDADKIPLNWTPDVVEDRTQRMTEDLQRAEVFEIWCKPTKKRWWIVKGHPRALRIDDDPYGLTDFFPMPPDVAVIRGTDTHIPVPEFRQYRDLAEQLDEITERIAQLTKNLKRRGVYDASLMELKRLAKAADNEFIPVENYGALMSKGGLTKAFEVEPVEQIAAILVNLHDSQARLEAVIDKVTGISDIMRGEGDSSETATQSRIKAQYGGVRIKDRQQAVQQMVRDLFRIKAEIIAEHFEPQVLQRITGTEITPEIMQILRDDKLRSYRIDIETDSTIFDDAEAEKESRIEAVTAISGIMQQSLPMMQVAPEFGKVGLELMSFVARTFKGGRQLEEVFDQLREEMMQRLANPPPPQPDPAMEAAQAKADAVKAKATADTEKVVTDLNAYREKTAIDAERMAREREYSAQEHEQRMRENAVATPGE